MTAANQEPSLQDVYRSLVLDHSRNPRHFGRPEHVTHVADGINPLCGDKLRLYLDIDDDGKIQTSGFEGTGCAISIASASLLTEAVIGLPVGDADACYREVTRRLTSGTKEAAARDDLEERLQDVRALDGVRAFPARVKCATLAWRALHAAIQNDHVPATTE